CPAGCVTRAPFDGGMPEVSSTCERYCQKVVPVCPSLFPHDESDTSAGALMSRAAACRAACARSPLAADDASVKCRTDEVDFIADGGIHDCSIASFASMLCTTPEKCQLYCQLGHAVCGWTVSSCVDDCASIHYVRVGDSEPVGDTLNCRMLELER